MWRASLRAGGRSVARLRATLSMDERARADRFVQAAHRDAFVCARGFLRDVLGRVSGRAAATLRFGYGSAGKPRLDDGTTLRFNLSHSDGVALLALTRGREVGVDVEALRAVPDALLLADRHMAASEARALRRVAPERRDAAFLRCWTLKEAYVKAVGDGLGMALDAFEVGFDAPAPRLRLLPSGATPEDWSLEAIDPGPGYVGALAREAGSASLACFDWEVP